MRTKTLLFLFSVPSVLNAFEFFRDSYAARPFNTENTEGTERRRHCGGMIAIPSDKNF